MRKVFFLLLFMNAAFSCFSDDFYESNILGMMLKKIDAASLAEAEYIMKVTSDDEGSRIKILLHNGEQVSRTEIKRDSGVVTEITKEENKTTTVKRENGIITSEGIAYEDGTTEKTEYNYKGRQLISAVFSANGTDVYTDEYYYTEQGRLLNVQRKYVEAENNKSISFIFNDGRISRFWLDSSESRNYIRFDRNGIVLNETIGSGGAREVREYFNMPDGSREELITDTVSGNTTRLTYDKRNRLQKSVFSNADGKIVERSDWGYRGNNLYSYKIRRDLSLEVYEYQWAEDGELLKEVYYKNGNIIQETEYDDKDNYTELLYRNGRAVLKIKYADGERTETVQLQEQ